MEGGVWCARWAYAEPGWARIASLAPAVLRCAEEGDPVAFRIVTAAADEAVSSVVAAATAARLKGQRFRLVLSGARLGAPCCGLLSPPTQSVTLFPFFSVHMPDSMWATNCRKSGLLVCHHTWAYCLGLCGQATELRTVLHRVHTKNGESWCAHAQVAC